MTTRTQTALTTLAFAVGLLLAPSTAEAFCGFYVSGADAELYNSATQVVMMREGQRTVLTMQNNYQGPTDDFALVIPVPIVLMEDNVKVVEDHVFDKVDQLTAPRLVEYWEQDPCGRFTGSNNDSVFNNASNNATNNGVDVEAEFKVGEYDVVVLSADDGTNLEGWLTDNAYNIPDGSAPYLDPYVQSGSYFFVARVDSERVTYEDGRAVLSPLRFWYDSEEFSLPIRLGLINATEVQDLLVYVLAQNQRYEVANYPNAFIPTNINLQPEVKERFGAFYNALFEETLRQNPGAVVTEYSWDASTCDPCPGPTLDQSDYLTLGADVTGAADRGGWVITRLHARYEEGNVGEDLVFQAADPVGGGRESYKEDGVLEEGAVPAPRNNFQGRYAIRHPWNGDIDCEDPVRAHWGGFGGDVDGATSPNTDGDGVDRGEGVVLADDVAEDVPEIGVVATNPQGLPGSGNNDTSDDRNNGVNNEGDPADDNDDVGDQGDAMDAGGARSGGGGGGGGCATATGDRTPHLALAALLGLLGAVVLARRR